MTSLRWLAMAVVVLAMTATACQRTDDATTAGVGIEVAGSAAGNDPAAEPTAGSSDGSSSASERESAAADGSSPDPLQLADEDLSLPPARGIDELAAAASASDPVPSTISIERLGLSGTNVLAVGVESNGEMTVPPPLDVGWYRYGPTPGEPGSAVLAGHIASGGVPGAFRYLDQLEAGDMVTIGFDDGSTRSFIVDELIQVDKTNLPFDTVFARSGPSRLALITCGGEFDYNARSYTDNVVAIASPVTG